MNIIEQWAELCESRFGYTSDDNVWGRERFGASRPDDFGAQIMHLFSPANFDTMENDEKMRASDFGCFMTDRPGVKMKLGRVENEEKLGNGLIGLFWFKEGTMTKEEMAEYFNKWCGSVLRKKYTADDFFFMNKNPKVGLRGGDKQQKNYEFYALNLTNSFNGSNFDRDDVEKKFNDEIKSEYSEYDMDIKIGEKNDFSKYMRHDWNTFQNMTAGRYYIGIFVLENSPVDINEIGKILETLTGKKYGEQEIIKLGKPIRRKYSKSGAFENFNLFLAKEK